MHLRAQENLDIINDCIIKSIKKKAKRIRVLTALKKLAKNEIVYIANNRKETRVVVGRYIGISRCCPNDKFDYAQGITQAVSNLVKDVSIINALHNGCFSELATWMKV